MRPILPLVLLTLFLAFGCGTPRSRGGYLANDFAERTPHHQIVAILPVQLTYTGRLPTDWTEARADTLRRLEAELLQNSLLSALLNRVSSPGRTYRVDFQAPTTTNNRLRSAGIEPYRAYAEDPAKVAATLGVDALVTTAVTKERYLSDETSAIISTANDLLSSVSNNPFRGALRRSARTYNVDVYVSLIDQRGVVLYSDRNELNMNWSTSPNESVEIMGDRISRSFPYQEFWLY